MIEKPDKQVFRMQAMQGQIDALAGAYTALFLGTVFSSVAMFMAVVTTLIIQVEPNGYGAGVVTALRYLAGAHIVWAMVTMLAARKVAQTVGG